MPNPLVLVVEDDKAVRNLLATALDVHGYQCRSAETGLASIQEALSYKPDVILLDLGLPDIDGITVLTKIRSWSRVPVIVVSARDEDKDKIEAFDAGADDFVTKPFSVDELMARLRTSLRRSRYYADAEGKDENTFCNGDLKIDYVAGCAFMADKPLHLTPMEYRLLCLLAKNTGKVLTHQYLFSQLWGRSAEDNASHLRVFMATLRKKLEGSTSSAQYIQTHIGIGYRMVTVSEPDA